MLKLLYPALFLGVLGGCMVNDNHPAASPKPIASATRMDSAAILAKTGDEPIPASGNKEFAYREPGTGIQYLINPQWKIMTRQPKGIAKSGAAPQTWTDWSGQVETRIYECASPTVTQHQNSIGCQVEPDFVLIGGGAYADYGSGPGALLWESRPLDPNLSTWVASSKDHEVGSPHRLYVYSVGLRLMDYSGNAIPRSVLGKYVAMRGHTSPWATHAPKDSVGGSEGGYPMLFFGTGGRLNWTCCGAFLTQSKAKYENNWMIGIAGGKDHRYSDPSSIDSYAVGMVLDESLVPARKTKSIPGFGRLEFKILERAGSAVGKGVAVSLLDVEYGYVLSGIGGQSVWTSGGGRMLFGMKPTGTYSGQIGIYSKDHRVASGGYNVATLVQIRREL